MLDEMYRVRIQRFGGSLTDETHNTKLIYSYKWRIYFMYIMYIVTVYI